jgi:hypothetical protein
MLGKRDRQGRLFSAATQLGREVVERMGFYGNLALRGDGLFDDEDFGAVYCADNGRPSVPPSLLAKARLLQYYDGVSDAETVERCRYDLRWKVALDLDIASVAAPFAKSTFQAFRVRLTLHEKEGLAFERSVQEAKKAGLLPKRLCLALDSSPVRGHGALKDTFNLLSDAIVAVLRAAARKRNVPVGDLAREAGVGRHIEASSIKGSEVVDWGNAKDVGRFLCGLLEDCSRVVDMAEAAECATDEVELLKKVIAQDVEESGPDGHPCIRHGVAPDRVVSIHDPEMRHGRKSSGKTYNGHKAHAAVEVTSGVITAVEVTAPAESDGSMTAPLLEQSGQTTGCEIVQALGDTAYSSRDALAQATAAGVDLVTKMPPDPAGRLPLGLFQVSEDHRHAVCPAGIESIRVGRLRDGLVHEWSPAACGACSLKMRCTKAAAKNLSVPRDFHERRRRERYALSEEGRSLLRLRMAIEHAFGRTKNLGARVARSFGRNKTRAQWLWTAAIANLLLVWNKQEACMSG